jgi:tetratricopeptide (TPR) repeat protein
MYGRAWTARRSPAEGGKYMDALLRRNPPDAETANTVLNELVAISGGPIDANPSLLAAQALVLRARGREDFALQQMTKAFEISMGNDARMATWATNASRMYEKMDPASELGYYRSLRSRYTQPDVRAWLDYIIARRSLALGLDATQALSELARLASSPDASEAIRGMAPMLAGSEHYRAGRYEEALTAWRLGLVSAPDSWELNNNIAFVLSNKLGRHEEALTPAEKAVESDQGRFEPYHTLANIYLGLEKVSEAEQMLRTAERLARTDSSRVSLAISRAKVALAKGQSGEASRQIEGARATLREIPGRDENLETEIELVESQIDSQR